MPATEYLCQGLALWSALSLSDSETMAPTAFDGVCLSAVTATSAGLDDESLRVRALPPFPFGNEPLFPRHFIFGFLQLVILLRRHRGVMHGSEYVDPSGQNAPHRVVLHNRGVRIGGVGLLFGVVVAREGNDLGNELRRVAVDDLVLVVGHEVALDQNGVLIDIAADNR